MSWGSFVVGFAVGAVIGGGIGFLIGVLAQMVTETDESTANLRIFRRITEDMDE